MGHPLHHLSPAIIFVDFSHLTNTIISKRYQTSKYIRISMKNSRICFQINKAKTKGLEEQTVDKVIDMEDFKDKTEEAFRLHLNDKK